MTGAVMTSLVRAVLASQDLDPSGRLSPREASTLPDLAAPSKTSVLEAVDPSSPTEVFHGYLGVFVVAFLVSVCATPIMRHLAVTHGVVDKPLEARKLHRVPVAYLGGVAVFLGMLAGIAFSYFGITMPESIYAIHESRFDQKVVPVSVVLGMTVIMLTGLIDDVVGLAPRVKVGGQLLAAAALAMQDVGTKVAANVMKPIGALIGNQSLVFDITLPFALPMIAPGGTLQFDLVYWIGTAIIAVFVLGACNATNLIDGLDGLCSGLTAIAAGALLVVGLMLAASDDGPLDSTRVVLAMAILGACLGFLPHNFNPATIFLGDCGSLMLGYMTILLVLTLGDTGKTHLVVAGLIIYAIPIIDTSLAIVRRKMAGKPLSAPDDQHLHHMLKRALGVKGAVFTLYGIATLFAVLGVMMTMWRMRIVFTLALVVAAFIGVTAVKLARRKVLEEKMLALHGHAPAVAGAASGPAVPPSAAAKHPPGQPDPARV